MDVHGRPKRGDSKPIGALGLACADPQPSSTSMEGGTADDLTVSETLVHELLSLEERYVLGCARLPTDSIERSRQTLDHLLSVTTARLSELGVDDWEQATEDEARSALTEIDRSLSREGFVTCVRTSFLSQALADPWPIDHADARSMDNGEQRCELVRTPAHRDADIRRRWRQGLRPVDCDLGAMLYLAVGERVGLPLSLVETPNHSFVRWQLAAGGHLNWDNNDAQCYTDDEYRQAAPRTTSSPFDAEQESVNRYLLDRSRTEILAYYAGLLVQDTGTRDCILGLHELTGQADWLDATTLNNFAWAFATRAELRGSEQATLAVELSRLATQRRPTCGYWDTLSCAHAAVGELAEAIDVERRHVSADSPRIAAYQEGRDCYDPDVADASGC